MIAETGQTGGVLLDYTHPEGKRVEPVELTYACVTSPEPQSVRVEVRLNDVVVDAVWVGNGASHSWWAGAGGPLIPSGKLYPGDHLVVEAVFGRVAFRIDNLTMEGK